MRSIPVKRSMFLILTVAMLVAGAEPVQPDSSVILPEKNPLYEQFPAASNPWFSQIVMNIMRWTTIGTMTGAGIGGIMDGLSHEPIFIPAAFIVGAVGMGAGFTTGIPVGVVSGYRHMRKKRENPDYHDYRCRFGYEVQMFSRSPFTTDVIHRVEDNFVGIPDFTLTWRPLAGKRFLPDKFRLGLYHELWGRHSGYEVTHFGRMKLKRVEAGFRYDLYNLKLLVPYWAAGIGYAWGREREEIRAPYYDPVRNRYDSRPVGQNEYQVSAPVLRGYIGSELNLFDFCSIDVSFGYEMLGTYMTLRHKEYFPYAHNFLISLSLGTFIF